MWPRSSVSQIDLTAPNKSSDWGLLGADAAVHVRHRLILRYDQTDRLQMSEEIENAALNVPRAIFTTVILNGATGFAMAISVLFCLGDAEAVLVSSTIYNHSVEDPTKT